MNEFWIKNFAVFTILILSSKFEECMGKLSKTKTETWFVPQLDGSMKYMNEEEAIKANLYILPMSTFSTIQHVNPNIFFFLYTEKNMQFGEMIQLNNTYSLEQSKFDPKYPTRIIIHGWRSRLTSPINQLICDAYLSVGRYNVIIVDWGTIANTINYVKARYSVPSVALQVADFIDFLHREGKMNFSDLIVIGHSLGAHVAGIAGQEVKTGKIPIIYGLDPAYPLFYYEQIDERLSDDDAEYVETIQTNAGLLGFKYPIGKTSFFPNWGKVQKGCAFDWNGMCSHRRSYKFFAELIKSNNFTSNVRCESVDNLLAENCNVRTKNIKMGSESNKVNTEGIYYLDTNSEEPFGLG
ncbi:phospholipase A1-like [Condylostylus longicornis]|uniref:phospholipase A1-like n=1 Tax=Condylostylus longicornis TaxID=2530218 RepID=UPI00244DD843|nr:phospholipase A1-like [Condylostylus longicornis]